MFCRSFLVFALISLLCSPFALAQKWEIGAHAGTAGYVGDLQDKYFFPTKSLTFSGGISGKYNLNQTLGFRLNLNYVPIKASNKYPNSDVQFTNTILETSAVVDFNFYEFRSRRGKRLFTPYVFAGFGYIYHDPMGTINQIPETTNQQSIKIPADLTRTTSYSKSEKLQKFVPMIPVGVGFKVNLLGPFSFGLQLQYRFAFSNYLDGFSDKDPNSDVLFRTPNNYATRWQSLIGNSRPRDSYFTAVFTVSYGIYKWRDPLW